MQILLIGTFLMSETAVSFAELGLSAGTLEVLAQRNYSIPTPIQALVIPKLLENTRDLIAQAKTGTGKTAAYALPVIEKLLADGSAKQPRAIVLSPTRELAMQIAKEVELFIGNRPLKVVTVYGGQNIEIQLKALKSGVDIVVGTPGRVIDLMERKALKLDKIEFSILDEADEMLDMGFVEDIELILSAAPEEKRNLMFSATVPAEARKIAEQFMVDAEYIKAPVSKDEEASPLTEQIAYEVRREDKFEALKRILHAEGRIYAMIFCRTRTDVDELTMSLQKNKFRAEALHGELTQNQRTRVIEQFKLRRFDMLVATDVAARGIDVNDLTHVINYALPTDKDIYTHRIGRTGRAGKRGVAISLFTPAEGGRFAMLRKATKGQLEQHSLPDAKAIIAAKKERFKNDLANMADKVNPAYLRMAEELIDIYDPATLLATMLDMKFHKELLQENYPPLSGGKRERRYSGSTPEHSGRGERNRDRDRDRNRHRDNDRNRDRDRNERSDRNDRNRDRNRHHDNDRDRNERGERNERNDRRSDRKFSNEREGREKFRKDSFQDNAENQNGKRFKERSRKDFSGDKQFEKAAEPRKRLRDWAIDLTGDDNKLPRYKVKKRK